MLIQGGMIRSGCLNTVSVDGLNWMSCIRSFWNTTLPGVVATLWPIRNAFSSVILMRSCPSPSSRSSSRFFRPFTRLVPPDFIVSRSTCGLVSAKFDGDSASTYWRVKKSTFFFDSAGRPVDPRHDVVDVARGDEVALLDVVEDEVVLPVLVLEAVVALRRRGDRLGRLAEELEPRRLPQPQVVEVHVHLRLRERHRVREQLRPHVHERARDAELVGDRQPLAVGVARHEVGEHVRRALGDLAEDLGDLGWGRAPARALSRSSCSSCSPFLV